MDLTAVFSEYSSSGALISEASIPIADQLSKQAIFVDNQNGLSTLITPLVQQRAMNPEFFRKRGDALAALQPLHRYFSESLRVLVDLSLFLDHFAVSFLQSVASVCLRLGVHSRWHSAW